MAEWRLHAALEGRLPRAWRLEAQRKAGPGTGRALFGAPRIQRRKTARHEEQMEPSGGIEQDGVLNW